MELPPFLLDRWIHQKHAPDSRIDYDLASSTGPVWTLRELLALADGGGGEGLLDTAISYTDATGSAIPRLLTVGQAAAAKTAKVPRGGCEFR
jgi:hypothetical protein